MSADLTPPGELSPEQLTEAALLARALQLIDATRQYGLTTGGPEINQDRCDDILAMAAERGCAPDDDLAAHVAVRLALEHARPE